MLRNERNLGGRLEESRLVSLCLLPGALSAVRSSGGQEDTRNQSCQFGMWLLQVPDCPPLPSCLLDMAGLTVSLSPESSQDELHGPLVREQGAWDGTSAPFPGRVCLHNWSVSHAELLQCSCMQFKISCHLIQSCYALFWKLTCDKCDFPGVCAVLWDWTHVHTLHDQDPAPSLIPETPWAVPPQPLAPTELLSVTIIGWFWECRINGIRVHNLWDWLLCLSIMSFRFIQAVVCMIMCLFAEWYSMHGMGTPQFAYPFNHWRKLGLFSAVGGYEWSCYDHTYRSSYF